MNMSKKAVGAVVADLQIADLMKALALSVATAQTELDRNSVAQVTALSEKPDWSSKSYLELGFSPPFYNFQYVDLEVTLGLTFKETRDRSVEGNAGVGDVTLAPGNSSSTDTTTNTDPQLVGPNASTADDAASGEEGTSDEEEKTSIIPYGATLTARAARSVGLEVTGNSVVKARLVSIPAPPELLAEIQTYLSSLLTSATASSAP